MKTLKTSLLREKFVIYDPSPASGPDMQKSITALSNRLAVDLADQAGRVLETFIVRAHNMHLCIRMASRLILSYGSGGTLMNRVTPYAFDEVYDSIVNDYERVFNPQRWIAVYHGGESVFASGERHPLLDVVERCNSVSSSYEEAIKQVEKAYAPDGKIIRIKYDGNVALTVDAENGQGRFGIICRGAERTATFNFSVLPKQGGGDIGIAQSLSVAAAFLEGIQLSFLAGMNEEKLKAGMIERGTTEEKQTYEARKRLSRLNSEIATFESDYTVRYRPERPDFQNLMLDAERLARRLFSKKPN